MSFRRVFIRSKAMYIEEAFGWTVQSGDFIPRSQQVSHLLKLLLSTSDSNWKRINSDPSGAFLSILTADLVPHSQRLRLGWYPVDFLMPITGVDFLLFNANHKDTHQHSAHSCPNTIHQYS